MKKSLFIFLATIICGIGTLNAQQKTVQVNKKAFTHLKQAYEKSDESKKVQRLIKNTEQRQIFENDVLGIFSLTPESFSKKTAAICNCRLREGNLKRNEVTAINNFLSSFRTNDQTNMQKHYDNLISLKDTSPLMSSIIKTINEGEQPTTQAGGRGLWRAVGIIIGGVAGGAIGGGGTIGAGTAPGAAIGALAGKEIADEAYDWYYGIGSNSGSNVMATPDGGDCTTPTLNFPLF